MITQVFIESKYKKWYLRLCENAKNRAAPATYTEKHHIIPRSFGGSNAEENVVSLTAREHYIAHLCLVKCTEGEFKRKMLLAVRMFVHPIKTNPGYRGMRINGRLFSILREQAKQVSAEQVRERCKDPKYIKKLSESQKSYVHSKVSPEGRANLKAASLRRGQNPEYRRKLSEAALKRSQNPIYTEKQRLSHLGKKHTTTWALSNETRERQRIARLRYWAEKQG